MKVNVEFKHYGKVFLGVFCEWDDEFICLTVHPGIEATFGEIAELCRVCNAVFLNGNVLKVPTRKVWAFDICRNQ